MLLGNPNKFAVEIYHEPESPDWTGFGRMCIHAQGFTIGNLQEPHCSLFHPVEEIVLAAKNLPELWEPRFDGHAPEEIFAWLDAIIYSGDIKSSKNEIEKFSFLTNCGEQFDDFKSFIYCNPEGRVFIPSLQRDNGFVVATCTTNEFRAVARELEQWFRAQVAA